MEQRWSAQSNPWDGYVNFTKVIFRPIKRLELFGTFSERSANYYFVLHRQNSTVAITIFCIVCFEAVALGLDDVLNNRLHCVDVPGIRLHVDTTSKNNLRKIHIFRPMP